MSNSIKMRRDDWIYQLSIKENSKDILYYLENKAVVFTEKYLADRGQCCGNKCRHCPYIPKHQKGNNKLNETL